MEGAILVIRRNRYLDEEHIVKFANLFYICICHFEKGGLKIETNPTCFVCNLWVWSNLFIALSPSFIEDFVNWIGSC